MKLPLRKDPKNAIFIINPASGGGDGQRRKTQVEQFAKELGWKGKIIATTRKRSASQIATEEITKGAKHIIICGGDGTIRSVLSAVIKTQAVLGIVPLGTGNLFAQNLDLDLDLKLAIQTALNGKIQKIDVGSANGALFAVMAGIGFDAEVMKKAKKDLKNKLGFFAYIVTALKHFHITSGLYKVIVDGKMPQVHRAKTIVFANMGRLQGGIKAFPSAHSQNGKLHVTIIQASTFPAVLSILINALRGSIHKSPHYKLLKGKKIEVIPLNGAKPYECDGDHFPPTKQLVVEIYPQILPILVKR